MTTVFTMFLHEIQFNYSIFILQPRQSAHKKHHSQHKGSGKTGYDLCHKGFGWRGTSL